MSVQDLITAIKSAEDVLVRYILTECMPIWLQHRLRDLGLLKVLSDVVFCSTALLTGLCRPQLFFELISDLYRSIRVQYGPSRRHFALVLSLLDSFSKTEKTQQEEEVQPIVIFVHGGAWGSGRPWQYLLIGKRLAQLWNACKVVVLGYPVYPHAGILQQKEAIKNALHYFHSIDPVDRRLHPIILCGHSSGAHICLLSLLDKESEGLVDAFMALNGVYDIPTHYRTEQRRGVEHLSPMYAAAVVGGENNTEAERNLLTACSPRQLLAVNRVENGAKPAFSFPPYMAFLHGVTDKVVSVKESILTTALLHQHQQNVSLFCPDNDHMSPLLDLIEGEQKGQTSSTLEMLKQAWQEALLVINSAK
eukprot:gene2191-2391_t